MIQPPSKKKTLASVVGVACAAILCNTVPNYEGTVLKGYRDPIGIPTKCMGDTSDVQVGKKYTVAECQASLQTQLIAHAEPVLKCTPSLKGRTYQLAAAVDFGYNLGSSAYCGSVVAKRFRAGDFKGACKAMNESDAGKPQYVFVKDKYVRDQYINGKWTYKWTYKPLPGLVKRRANDRKLCETGI